MWSAFSRRGGESSEVVRTAEGVDRRIVLLEIVDHQRAGLLVRGVKLQRH